MKRILLATAMAALPLAAPLAADAPPAPPGATDVQKAPPGAAGAQQAATASESQMQRQALPKGSLRASDLIDRDVETPDGDTLGEIEDVIVSNGGAPYAIFDVGGFLGIGDHEIAVPLDQLQVGEDRVVYDTTREALADHPRYYFPDAPLSGSVRPGPERSQAMSGEGNPRQPAEHNLAVERLRQEGDAGGDLADGGGRSDDGGGAITTEAPWSKRQAYLDEAGRAVDTWTARAESAEGLDDGARQNLTRYTKALQSRYDALKQASEANWQQLQENFAVQLGKVRDTLQEASTGTEGGSTAD